MSKLNNNDIMDYLDGTLSEARRSAVEEHLRTHAEDAQLVAEMKMAQEVLRDWHEAEPVPVSEAFWPKLREKLPAQPGRSWLHRLSSQMGEWLLPRHSPLALSMRAGVVALVLGMAAFLFAPEQATHQVQAEKITAEDRAFIQQSLDHHAAYVSSQPLGSSAVTPAGDASSIDTDDGEDGGEYTP